MGRNDDNTSPGTGDLSNDTGLVVAVSVTRNLDGRVARRDGNNIVVHPGCALCSVAPTIVAVVDACQAVSPARQVGLRSKRDQSFGLGLMGGSCRDGLCGEGVLL